MLTIVVSTEDITVVDTDVVIVLFIVMLSVLTTVVGTDVVIVLFIVDGLL